MQYIIEAEGQILLFIQEFLRFEWLNPIVVFLTKLVDGGLIWILLATCLLCFKKYRKTGTAMAVALMLGVVITNLILKNMVVRIRPYDVIEALQPLVRERSWSFPSGHATSSLAAGYVMYKKLPRYMGIPAIIFAVIICLSRMYVGVHYPTDVICGGLIGWFCAMCAMKVTGNGK